MKRIASFVFCVCFLLSGCSFGVERIREPVTFHYLCSEYQDSLCCVFVSEEREAAGHTGDLTYLLGLYLMGPASDEMDFPLPSGTKVLSSQKHNAQVLIELSDTEQNLSDIDYSLACACLTLTCLDMTDAESVTVTSGTRSVTMTRESLALYDSSAETTPMEDNG